MPKVKITSLRAPSRCEKGTALQIKWATSFTVRKRVKCNNTIPKRKVERCQSDFRGWCMTDEQILQGCQRAHRKKTQKNKTKRG